MTTDAEFQEVIEKFVGKKIAEFTLDAETNRLLIVMDDHSCVAIFDDAQYCCEERFMVAEDALSDYVGATLLGVEASVVNNQAYNDVGYNDDMAFLNITTSLGIATITNHNIHNGYYEGFDLVAREETPDDN